MKSWIYRPGGQIQLSVGGLAQRFHDGVSMPRPSLEGGQQQRIQMAFQLLSPHK
jgi:hypothetical protein